jgi:predicted NBD/HSP70 family sugar kinase
MEEDVLMTHDELLAKIDHSIDNEVWLNNLGEALRAVVELHKPERIITGGSTMGNLMYGNECSFCRGSSLIRSYPCPTIQAIEKELR